MGVYIVYTKSIYYFQEFTMSASQRVFASTLVFFVLFFTSFSASAFSGIPKTYPLAGKQLILNGEGTRTKFIISVYQMGLYLQQKNKNAAQIINANEPMAIRIKIISGFASADKMKHAIKQGFKAATGGKTAPIQAQINQLISKGFSSKINKRDIFDLAYTPAGGTKVIKNGKPLTVIKGLPFKRALFGIWLSTRPVQSSLKNELLGGSTF